MELLHGGFKVTVACEATRRWKEGGELLAKGNKNKVRLIFSKLWF